MISLHFQGKPSNIKVIQVYALTSNVEEADWMVLGWSPRPSRTNTQKRYSFHHRGLEYKNMKSRDTWNNRKVWPWSTKQRKAKANRVLPREQPGHSKHPLLTTREKTLHMDITRWLTSKSDWLYSLQPKMEKLDTVNIKQDQELTTARIMNSLLPNSDINWRKYGKPLDHSGMT